jgi:GNAT superfamily N-acetyltransferase
LFATSSGVRECWCMWPRRPRGMHSADRIANAAAMKELLDSGQSPGLIAVAEGRALGWCAAGPRATYPQYTPTTDPSVRWAVPCLYVRQTADNRSVARALIAAAVALACENGAVTVDGPPPYWLPGDTDAVAAATRAFLENGFENVGPGARMPELRHRLHVLPDR